MSKDILIDSQSRILIKEDNITKYFYCNDHSYNVGDIFIGQIAQKNDTLNAFFVNFGDSKNGFLPYKNLYNTNVKVGDFLFIQIKKEMRDNKGAYLTNIISLTSHYFVYIPYSRTPGFYSSKKLTNTETTRIKSLICPTLSDTDTLIARTESNQVEEKKLLDDAISIVERWKKIENSSNTSINKKKNLSRIFNIIYDHLDTNTRILVQNKSTYERIVKYVTSSVEIDSSIDIDQEINYIVQSRILLPSQAMISIDITEAIISIDVNSFKSKEKSRHQINLEAGEEIIRQILVKNLSGLIVIDFISDNYSQELLEFMKQRIKIDKLNTEVSFLEKMYLCVISRERKGKNIWQIMGKKCPMCDGYGQIPTDKTYYNFHLHHLHDNVYIPESRIKYFLQQKSNIDGIQKCKYDKYNIFTQPFPQISKLLLNNIKLEQQTDDE